MRHRFPGAGLLLASLLALPVLGAPTPAPTAKKTGAAVDAENLPAGQFSGTLLTTPGSDRTFTLRIPFQRLQVNTSAPARNNTLPTNLLSKQQEIVRLQSQMARSRNPLNELRRIQQLITQMQQEVLRQRLHPQQMPYRVVTSTQDVEFQIMEDAKVRTLVLPPAFDDRGKSMKYTANELRELKGKDTNLPGYESSVENLTQGQVVRVTLAAKKPNPANKDKDKDLDKDKAEEKAKGPDKAKENEKGTTAEKKMQVRLVVIVKDDSATAAGGPAQGKKK
jgi:hypothetical protein